MNKEEIMLRKRLEELSNQAYQRDIVTFSDFLNLNELNILHTIPKDMFPAHYETYGGYELAERQMVAFLPDALYYEYQYPIYALSITPANRKYAEDLGHRDYLGAILNLGIERCKIGDLAIQEQDCIIFCCENMADYISEQLTRVRHTMVTLKKLALDKFTYSPDLKEQTGTVASIRLDAVLSIGFSVSRSKIVGLIEDGKVYVNGKLITSNGYRLKENDIISIRGYGRIIYEGIISETRKGRYMVRIYKY